MVYKVLVVDDSTFFRRRIKQILDEDPNLTVIGEARNGQEAINMVRTLNPDVVTMDIEMPVMDGIEAVKRIMADNPVPIIMFSSLTHVGAKATLDALDAGALDFLPKKFEDIAVNRQEAVTLLQSRVKSLCTRKTRPNLTSKIDVNTLSKPLPSKFQSKFASTLRPGGIKKYQCLAIGTSTGGPVALQKILVELPENFPLPIILVQHMPGTFTTAFAERLNSSCHISVKEAQDGDRLEKGAAYLAPGGRQMQVEGRGKFAKIKISDAQQHPNEAYKPSVDLTFQSLAQVFQGEVLGIILTGMGADGREGCRALHQKGAKIWAQDEQSSVVYGMPLAVTVANIAEQNFALTEFANMIKQETMN
ncbi:MAG: two-component system chemotaxis response regulator CheB [Paraglaciecola sp.]|jgi:two-component system chemotaxis response regulator CheB